MTAEVSAFNEHDSNFLSDGQLNMTVVVGHDCRFGRDAEGDFELLAQMGAEIILNELLTWPTWQQAMAPGVGLVLAAVLLRYLAAKASPATSDAPPRPPSRSSPGSLAFRPTSSCGSNRLPVRRYPKNVSSRRSRSLKASR